MKNITQQNQDISIHRISENSPSVTAPSGPLISSQTPPFIPKKSKMTIIILLVLIVMIVVAGSFFTLMQSGKQQTSSPKPDAIQSINMPTQSPTTVPPTSPAPTPPQVKIGSITPIDNTQSRYKNEKYEFEMNLPANFYITQEGFWVNEGDGSAEFYVDLSAIKPEDVPGREFPGIRIIVRNFSGDLTTYVREMDVTGFYEYDPTNPPKISKLVVDNKLAYQLFNNYYVVNNGKIYSINNGIEKDLFNQIISSFKFTD